MYEKYDSVEHSICAESEGNWMTNGDGETGPCATDHTIVPPTAWSVSGPVTQVKYGTQAANQRRTDPGPRYENIRHSLY